MYYVLYGKDTYRSRNKLNELIDFFQKKLGELGVFRIEKENFDFARLEEFWRGQTLFRKKFVIICQDLLSDKKVADFVIENRDKIVQSPNIFIFLEEEIKDDLLEALRSGAEKIQHFDLLSGGRLKNWIKEEAQKMGLKISSGEIEMLVDFCGSDLWCVSRELEKKFLSLGSGQGDYNEYRLSQSSSGFNIFDLCDAFAKKDKKTFWVLFHKALLSGITPEEIFWKLWWQMKNLLLVNNLVKAKVRDLEKESGLHPFVVKKMRGFIKNFNDEELTEYASNLIEIYHRSKTGEDLEILLERFILNL